MRCFGIVPASGGLDLEVELKSVNLNLTMMGNYPEIIYLVDYT